MSFDAIPLYNKDRYQFTGLFREFVSMGFVFSNQVTQESRQTGVIGYFIKKRG